MHVKSTERGVLRVVFLVRRGDLLSRRSLCGHDFPWELQTFLLSKKGPRRSEFGGRSEKTLWRGKSTIFAIVIVFLVRKGPLGPRVRKIFVCNSGAGNGCANFMDAWEKSVRSAGKPPCP